MINFIDCEIGNNGRDFVGDTSSVNMTNCSFTHKNGSVVKYSFVNGSGKAKCSCGNSWEMKDCNDRKCVDCT